MYNVDVSEGDNFFDSICEVFSQLGSSLIYLCIAFMLVAIGLFFLAKFRKVNKELKQMKYAPVKTHSEETPRS